ncbi:MAG TPA: PQ-loop domain-containing transporter [Arachnia sp.]|nr:PQ-loop domain-containing transporter [Arachnia sp.]
MIEVFGWVAAAIGVASNIPQLLRILRAKTSAGVSLRLWQISAATTGAWMVHGFLVQQPQMQWPNVLMSTFALVIVVFVLRDRKQAIAPQLVLPVVLAASLSSVELIFGAMAFGFVIAVPQLYGQLSQLREMVTAPDLSGVSLGYLVIMLVVQTMFFIFGLFTFDWALIICAGLTIIVCTVNLMVYVVRHLRARRRVALAV